MITGLFFMQLFALLGPNSRWLSQPLQPALHLNKRQCCLCKEHRNSLLKQVALAHIYTLRTCPMFSETASVNLWTQSPFKQGNATMTFNIFQPLLKAYQPLDLYPLFSNLWPVQSHTSYFQHSKPGLYLSFLQNTST